jgi:Domain of unknown function (DUF4160)
VGKQYELFRLADGFYRVLIFQPDHLPPHIHLKDATGQRAAIVELESFEIVVNDGFKQRELNYVLRYLKLRQMHVLQRWHELQSESEDDNGD